MYKYNARTYFQNSSIAVPSERHAKPVGTAPLTKNVYCRIFSIARLLPLPKKSTYWQGMDKAHEPYLSYQRTGGLPAGRPIPARLVVNMPPPGCLSPLAASITPVAKARAVLPVDGRTSLVVCLSGVPLQRGRARGYVAPAVHSSYCSELLGPRRDSPTSVAPVRSKKDRGENPGRVL